LASEKWARIRPARAQLRFLKIGLHRERNQEKKNPEFPEKVEFRQNRGPHKKRP
jgi:hypothetical protein